GAELARAAELLVARRRDDRLRAERLRNREAGGRDAAPDAPEENPLVRLEPRARDEHAVRRLEDERERRRLLEREPCRDGIDVRRRNGDQLGVRAVAVLADHVDRPVVGLHAGVDDDAVPTLEAADTVTDRSDDAAP